MSGDMEIKIIKEERGVVMPVVLRGTLNNNKTIDILGYDLELGKFDCSDGKTLVFDDFKYFIVTKDELKSISDRMNSLVEKPKVVKPKRDSEIIEIKEDLI